MQCLGETKREERKEPKQKLRNLGIGSPDEDLEGQEFGVFWRECARLESLIRIGDHRR